MNKQVQVIEMQSIPAVQSLQAFFKDRKQNVIYASFGFLTDPGGEMFH